MLSARCIFIPGADFKTRKARNSGVETENCMGHGGIKHRGNKAAMNDIAAVAVIERDAKFENAGLLLDVDIDDIPPEKIQEWVFLLIERGDDVVSIHW